MGWLSGWQYRKSHVINSANGAGTNYQVRIKAHYGSGTDSGADVYLNSHCRGDFGDVRFTDDDGETLLDYWMEEKVDSDYAIFWVEVADDLSTANQTIYIYYGKSDATTVSNGDNTFIFFDNFPGTSLDTNKWNTLAGSKGSYSVNNALTLTVTERYNYGGWMHVYSKNTFDPAGKIFEARINSITQTYTYAILAWHKTAPSSPGDGGFTNAYRYEIEKATQTRYRMVKDVNSVGALLAGPSGDATPPIIIGALWASTGSEKEYGNRNLALSATDSDLTIGNSYVGLNLHRTSTTATSTAVFSWVLIRKFVDPEPSHGSWGSEETPSGQTYEIYVNAISQSFAIFSSETAYNIAKEASVASQSLTASETQFNLIKDAIAKALAEFRIETKFNIEKDAVSQALALAVVEVVRGVIEILKEATTTAQTALTLESTFNINPEATIKVLAEATILKPTEVKITKLFLILGDLAIQIQGS
ncbi:MAG: DUF2341 domain-containing protein [Candidatus Bathycorpusculaceae bacterium]